MVIYLIATKRRLRTQVNVFIVSLAVADLASVWATFRRFSPANFTWPVTELRNIFAAYFEYTSLTNLCVLIADRYVAIVMPFQLCIIHDVKMRGYHGDSQLAASSGLLLSSGDDIKTAGFRRHHDNFQNTIRICVSAHTLLFAATFDNTDVLHRVQALERNDNSCFTVTI